MSIANWNPTAFYLLSDLVFYSGSVWECVADNTNEVPVIGSLFWIPQPQPSASGSSTLMFWADQTRPSVQSTLSVIDQYINIFVNNLTILSPSQFSLPKSGGYLFEVETWQCGVGDGTVRVIVTRNGNPVYDRTRAGSLGNCGVGEASFFWNQFQAGDVVEIWANANNTGTVAGTVNNQVSAQLNEMGSVRIYYVEP